MTHLVRHPDSDRTHVSLVKRDLLPRPDSTLPMGNSRQHFGLSASGFLDRQGTSNLSLRTFYGRPQVSEDLSQGSQEGRSCVLDHSFVVDPTACEEIVTH